MIIAPIDPKTADERVAVLKRQLEEAQDQVFWSRVDEKVNAELKDASLYADMRYDGMISLSYGVENVEARKEISLEQLVDGCISTYDDKVRVVALRDELARLTALVDREIGQL